MKIAKQAGLGVFLARRIGLSFDQKPRTMAISKSQLRIIRETRSSYSTGPITRNVNLYSLEVILTKPTGHDSNIELRTLKYLVTIF